MEKFLIEATIGRALEGLLTAVSQARDRAHNYESILAQLEFTIRSIAPKIYEIDRLSEEHLPDDVVHRIRLQLIRGKELVDKCSKSGCCAFYNSQRYYKKLQELDDSLGRLIMIDLQVKMALDVVRISADMKELCRRWDDQMQNVHEGGGQSAWIFKLSGRKLIAGLKKIVLYKPNRILLNLVTCGAMED
ncbi:protein RESISTANCE TO POWDERY MILDEW 8.2-like [Rosa rugosa]|uniref:protein RESISTANCE TO POWDERY MILDEW 8.2-like n=1 Tax=Rosa rugosa TaxID=74645 RepID=UPI002B40395F|nr:protein RESISTANCE TO POWDERY MILDEW 8.2-like [Rosa rugosa]